MNIRTLLLALAAALAIAFAACGDDDDDRPSTTATGATTIAATQTASAAATPTPSPPATFFDCGATHASMPPDASAFPVTITDTAGNTVTLDAPPARIASLDAAHTEILFAIGAGDQVTAVDKTSDCPTTVALLPQVDAFTPSLEAIAALEPDLVVLFYDAGDIVAALQSADIDVLLLETPPTVVGAYEDIELLGEATGHLTEAQELVTTMSEEVEAVEASVAGQTAPSVFHELDSTYFTVGDGSFVDDLYTILGANNIGRGLGLAGPQLSSEAIIAENPDVIILADTEFGESAETVAARPGWSNINAVKNGLVVGIDTDIVSRPGPRIVDALRLLKFALYG
jgi:iron complex transport system substrate-binding protein